MKKIIGLMLTIFSIAGTLCAQEKEHYNNKAVSGAEKTFETDAKEIERRIWIDLGKGNRLQLELQDLDDLESFMNIDSLLMVFVNDMRPFADSLGDLLAAHRIDYVSDPSGKKNIRLQTFKPLGSSFLLDQGEPASLKLEQDTINIIIVTRRPERPRWDNNPHRSRLTLYLNHYHELDNYVTGGLNEKIHWLQKNINGRWVNNNGVFTLDKDNAISATSPRGSVVSTPGKDYMETIEALGVGNYKNYFLSSFGLGMGLHFNRPNVRHEIDILWEPNFIFQNNAQGHLQTYRNDFLVLNYLQEKTEGFSVFHQLVRLSPSASLAYLIRRRGEYFDKNTFRLGVGGLRFFDGGLTIEPCLFFNNFFQQTTPGVKMTLGF